MIGVTGAMTVRMTGVTGAMTGRMTAVAGAAAWACCGDSAMGARASRATATSPLSRATRVHGPVKL